MGKTGKIHLSARDLAYCGLFGAAALLFPTVFHLVRLGHVFMPMYLPIIALAFFVPPLPAAVTALIVPILSGAVTGMPPFYPPTAVFMSLELAVMSALIAGGGLKMGQAIGSSTARGERPKDRPYTVQQVLSTVYQVLGIDPARTFPDGSGRPIPILDQREPVVELL